MAEHSPTPWRVEIVNRTFHVDAADGGFVALFVSEADAAFIVEAVNERVNLLNALSEEQERGYLLEEERDRLRDLVRRLLQMCREDWARTNEAGRALLREAREAIGEAQP